MTEKLNLKLKTDGKLPPKWALRAAVLFLPRSVRNACNLWFVSMLTTLHPKGLQATLQDILELQLGGKLVVFKAELKIEEGTEHTKGDF